MHTKTDFTDSSPQAAVRYNYAGICAVYFLSSIGLGGNIPIDAAIALEFLPQNRRFLVALLGIWQPIGVVVASAVAFGTAAKYRCDVNLPACNSAGLDPGQSCCTVASNMGWRYDAIVLGTVTLLVFVGRYLIFNFHESPKFLVSQGRDQEAIDVLNTIARFNKTAMPSLRIEDFQLIDSEAEGLQSPTMITSSLFERLRSIRGLFLCRIQCFTFFLLAIAYMVSHNPSYQGPDKLTSTRVITGLLLWQAPSSQSYCSGTTSVRARMSWRPIGNISISTSLGC